MSPPTAEQVTAALAGVHDPEIHRPITELGMVKSVDVARGRRGARRGLADRRRLPAAGHHHPRRHRRGRQAPRRVRGPGGPGRDERGAAPGPAEPAARRAARARDPVRPAGLADPGVRGRQRQGRGRQVVGDGQPGRGAGRRGPEGRRGRRRHLRPLGAADAGRDRPAHPGRADDHAAVGARREGHLDRDVHHGQRAGGVARADAAPGRCSSSSPTCTGATWTCCCWTCRRAPATWPSPSASWCPSAELLVVTTPQLASAEVAERAGAIAVQTHQRIAGVIENMSCLPCPHCGEQVEVFGSGGGAAVADALTRITGAQVPLLGQVPIDVRLREGGDGGVPLVLSDPESPAAPQLSGIADGLGSRRRGLAGRQLGLTPALSGSGRLGVVGRALPRGEQRAVGPAAGCRRPRRSSAVRRRHDVVEQVLAHEVAGSGRRGRSRRTPGPSPSRRSCLAPSASRRRSRSARPAWAATFGSSSGPKITSAITASTSSLLMDRSNTLRSPSRW